MPDKTSIRRQTLVITTFSYLGIAVGFLTQGFLIPNYLTVEQKGLTELLLSFTLIFSTFANLGFNPAGTRLFPYFRTQDKTHNGYFRLSLWVSLCGLALIYLFLFFGKPYMKVWYAEKSSLFLDYYWTLYPLVGFTLFFNVFDNFAKLNFDSVTGTVLTSFVGKFLNFINILLLALGVYHFEQYPLGMILIQGFAFAAMLLKLFQKNEIKWVSTNGFLTKPIISEFVRFGSISVLTSLSSQIVFKITEFMLSAYKGLVSNGIYGNATLFTTVIGLPTIAVYKVTSTVISEAWKVNDHQKIAGIYQKSCLMLLIAGMLFFLGIVCNLHNVFAILPKDYEAGKWVIILLGLSKVFDMALGINGVIISTSKYYYFDTVTFLLLSVFSIVANSIIIPKMGLNGAGVVSCISIFIFNLARYIFIYHKFRFQPLSYKNLLVVLLGLGIWSLNYLTPTFTNTYPQIALDLATRSLCIALVFLGAIYYLKLSVDFNSLVDQSWSKIKKWWI